MSEWQPIETAPKDGRCLLAIATDDGYTFGVLDRDERGNWIHEGEPTFCHSYYFQPTHWMPLPEPPAPVDPEPEPERDTKTIDMFAPQAS